MHHTADCLANSGQGLCSVLARSTEFVDPGTMRVEFVAGRRGRGPTSSLGALPLFVASMLVPASAWAAPPAQPDYEALVNKKKGMCLDPEGQDGASRANVRLAPCDGKPDQRWTFRQVPGYEKGVSEIVNQQSGLCLDVKGIDDIEERANVMLYACDKNQDQFWWKESSGGGFELRNSKLLMEYSGGMPTYRRMCLHVHGSNGNSGDNIEIYRCNDSTSQTWSSASTGVKVSPPTDGKLCMTNDGPCFSGNWTAANGLYEASGTIGVASLPAAGVSLDLVSTNGVGANLNATEFALAGDASLKAVLPLGSELINLALPSGSVAVGTGRGVTSILGKGTTYLIGSRPYKLQPAGFYAHAAVNAAMSLEIAGITASVPSGGSAEVFLGVESKGPSIYLSGDCNIPIVGPPKKKGGPATSIANISSCTLGWFGTTPLSHTLSTAVLDHDASLPPLGGSLPTVTPTVDAAILLGGAIEFAALPGVVFDGMMALDPDATVANSVSFKDLARARAALEGAATIAVGDFSMPMGSVSMIYDAKDEQLDFGGRVAALEPLKAIGASFHSDFGGTVFVAGSIGKQSNRILLDFGSAKIFGFELKSCRGQLDLDSKTISVKGELQLGASWIDVSGSFGPNTLSLQGSSAIKFGDKTLTSSSLKVGTDGVTVTGRVSLLGETFEFVQTLETPKTIKAKLVNLPAVSIPGVGSANFQVWAEYTMGGNLRVKAKLKTDVGPLKSSTTYSVNSKGEVMIGLDGAEVPIEIM